MDSMPRRIIEAGRLEVKGAAVRFKEKGTLAASDRNLAELTTVRVRTTPAPSLRLFADFVFPGEVFRIWQDATLINFREFLEKVAPAGPENFRATVAYLTRALPPEGADVTTREFTDGKPAERFANKDELSLYDRALEGKSGKAAPAPAPPPVAESDSAKLSRTEDAWRQFEGDIARERTSREESLSSARSLSLLLCVLGLVVVTFSFVLFIRANHAAHLDERKTSLLPITAVGILIGLALGTVGLVYLRRGSGAEKSVSDRG